MVVVPLLRAHGAQVSENQHIRELIRELRDNSLLHQELLAGARGDGIHQVWMDSMRRQGIKCAVVWIAIEFNHAGRAKEARLHHVRYFANYEGADEISGAARHKAIRDSGLEKRLIDLAMAEVAKGSWVDVPRPRPHPFVGGSKLVFFDDEWLPTVKGAAFCAGEHCLE